LSLFYLWNKQINEADENLQKYLLMFPDAGFAHNFRGQILLAKGDYANALIEVEKGDDPFWNLNRKSMVVYAMGNKTDADALLKQLIDKHGNYAWPNIAHVYAFRGEKDEAFKWLELAYDNKDASLLEILNYPEMENLWGDPRWNAFINKLGLPKDHGFHLDSISK
jgi:tetratricopeptide (TPR) repeat protein